MNKHKWTWLGYLNFFILQWFFIRLGRVGEYDNKKKFIQSGWTILKWILPLTGWWNDYIYIRRF